MTIRSIKKQALALMFTNYNDELGEDVTIQQLLGDENYVLYLPNMDWAINRCLQRFESVKVLPLLEYDFTYDEQERTSDGKIKPFQEISIDNIRSVERVIYESDKVIDTDVHFDKKGSKIVLKAIDSGKYTILVNPRAKFVDFYTEETYQLSVEIGSGSKQVSVNIPDSLCSLIPLFIKAELYEEDEPQLASQSRNIFEGMLADYILNSEEDHRQINVTSVFEG